MKKFLFSVATVTLLIACNNNPKSDTTITPAVMNVDSINRSQADKNQAVQMNGVSDTIIGSDGQIYIKSKPGQQPQTVAPVRSTVKNRTPRSTRTRYKSRSQGSSTANTGGSSSGTSSTGGSATNSGVGNSGTSTTTTTTEEAPKKKGWSNAAKGTAIGAASGAVAGAIISKNKGVGAVVGGLIGAGGGYIIGRKKDKKKQAADSINQ